MQKSKDVSVPVSYRRIVTTKDENGASKIHIDGSGLKYGGLHEFWMTDLGYPNDTLIAEDPVNRKFNISPTKGGSVFRFVEIEPESRFDGMSMEERRESTLRAFTAVNSADALVDQSRHPAMHQTNTIDYIILLKGELTMLLDDGEVDLKPNDVVVQRGTNHAWVNKSDTSALVAAVLVSAE